MNAPFRRTKRKAITVKSCSPEGAVFDYGEFTGVRLPLLGLYQPLNAANVIEAVKLLRTRGLDIPDGAVYYGLASAKWKGRFEKLCEKPLVFFDGGHNIEGVTAAVETVGRYFGGEKVNLISGVMADKRYEEMAALMARAAGHVYTVAPDNARALGAERFAEVFRSLGVEAKGYENYASAVRAALADCEREGRPLLALGSLYAYAPFKAALMEALKAAGASEA